MARGSVASAAAAALLALTGCGPLGSYGNAQDHSRFTAAALLPDRTVLFSFSRLVYRPASGITAFPDGGIPKYLEDESILGTYHIPTGALKILRRERNARWSPGQGRFGIQGASGAMALVNQGGQLRRDLAQNLVEHWLVDTASGAATPVDWRAALAERGLAATEVRLLDGRGTLLFVTVPLAEADRPREATDCRLLVRTAAGAWVEVARTEHYERVQGDELVYWMPATRRHHAYHLVTGATRALPDYRAPAHEDVTEGVIVDTHGAALSHGRKIDGAWRYEPIPLTAEQLRWTAAR